VQHGALAHNHCSERCWRDCSWRADPAKKCVCFKGCSGNYHRSEWEAAGAQCNAVLAASPVLRWNECRVSDEEEEADE
jgi:hypothetical protein